MSDGRFFIVIPTRNRHDTLRHAIRTALQQNVDALTVIVSDNYSTPETRAVVDEFDDPRLRYRRTDRSMSMMNSWEFALGGVDGDGFVHFMGDDNGLTPDAVVRVAAAVAATGLRIVHGEPVQYTWPNADAPGGILDVPTAGGSFVAESRRALKSVYRQTIGFDRLPTINAAFVHTSIIAKSKAIGGRYFGATAPDVYSSAANAMCVDHYVYLRTPFLINGASRHSNGVSLGQSKPNAFVSDTLADGYSPHPAFPPSRSTYFNVYESLATAAANFAGHADLPALDMALLARRVIREEYVASGRYWLRDDIAEFLRRHGLPQKIPEPGAPSQLSQAGMLGRATGERVCFSSAALPIATVFDASRVVAAIQAHPASIQCGAARTRWPAILRRIVREQLLMNAESFPALGISL